MDQLNIIQQLFILSNRRAQSHRSALKCAKTIIFLSHPITTQYLSILFNIYLFYLYLSIVILFIYLH